ncbi:uncharacterized protein [Gossypium hirsutum]|uniref:Endonuclease/exonuclease/phosphatase domain-containing protein n=1 Tax=Gossypium hirsutum TaxID=3635 RepID=A0ABM2YVB5_GOSHI|nr:uncharacterized protein LOC121207953 [Gossypium hirsutum]
MAYVYGSPNRQKRQLLWNKLRNSIPLGQSPWIAIGDFNAILSSSEKYEGLSRGRRCPYFGNFVASAELHDLGFRGPPFTWHKGVLFERLDHAMGNEAWLCNFLNYMVTHLPKIKSDHRPLFLDFSNIAESLGKFTHDLKYWNKHVYCYITTRKRDLIKRIANIQRKRDFFGFLYLNQVDLSLRQELENVLHHEELLWKQKAMCDWLKLGDRNKKFFHTREANEFFQRLYREIPAPLGNLPPSGFPQLHPVDVSFLGRPVSNIKIKEAMFDMAPLKAPGSDGFHAIFFQKHWDTLGEVVCDLVRKAGFIAERNINENFILAQEVIHKMRSQKK